MRALRRRRLFKRISLGLIGLVAITVLVLTFLLRGSLPALEGSLQVHGLASSVTIERDQNGVPTVRGNSRVDVARATGFLHGQERFFQMDLLRRRAAGELSELIGPATIDIDESVRVHRFRDVAQKVVASNWPLRESCALGRGLGR